MRGERGWGAALAEHEAAVAELLDAARRVAPGAWWTRPAPERWSPAEEVLHVTLAYEFGSEAVQRGAAMRLRVPRVAAWLSGRLILPLLLWSRRFPRGAASPGELLPSPVEARQVTAEEAGARLARAARTAAEALRRADHGPVRARVTHAYFGSLSARAALRLLSAHTRHHARRLSAARGAVV